MKRLLNGKAYRPTGYGILFLIFLWARKMKSKLVFDQMSQLIRLVLILTV
ncbi:MAG: hypothetical protein LBJ00_11035 [Planctomycetaceae bacterium]|nr:hypothetical protein [Planctomycetaceae bacterium]